jgi:tRNA pseudouridine55 synthase
MSEAIHGLLLINKPLGVSSHHVVADVRRILNIKKCGHTGTLDVLASGMLPLCLGEATKLAGFLLSERKQYTVEATLGAFTETGDAEGRVVATKNTPDNFNEAALKEGLKTFVGTQMQTPPMYSALKHKGKPLYEYAREGKTLTRMPREITIHSCELIAYAANKFRFRVICSKGTYVRVLVEDIAKKLGLAAFVSQLHRDWVFPHQEDNMLTLENLKMCVDDARFYASHWIPLNAMLSHWPRIFLNEDQVKKIKNGVSLTLPNEAELQQNVRLFGTNGDILGIGSWEKKIIYPKRLFVFNAS